MCSYIYGPIRTDRRHAENNHQNSLSFRPIPPESRNKPISPSPAYYHYSVLFFRVGFFGTRTSQYKNTAAAALNPTYAKSIPTLRQRSEK